MTEAELAAAQKAENEKTKGDWIVKDGLLVFTGHGENLATEKKYRDIEMYVDWKITEKGDAGIYLRGSPRYRSGTPAEETPAPRSDQAGSTTIKI